MVIVVSFSRNEKTAQQGGFSKVLRAATLWTAVTGY